MTEIQIDEVRSLLNACIPASAEHDMPKFSDVSDVAALVSAFVVKCGKGGDLHQKLLNALIRIKDGEKPQLVECGVIIEMLILEAYFTAPAVVRKLKEEPDRLLAEHEAVYNDYVELLDSIDVERKIYRCV